MALIFPLTPIMRGPSSTGSKVKVVADIAQWCSWRTLCPFECWDFSDHIWRGLVKTWNMRRWSLGTHFISFFWLRDGNRGHKIFGMHGLFAVSKKYKTFFAIWCLSFSFSTCRIQDSLSELEKTESKLLGGKLAPCLYLRAIHPTVHWVQPSMSSHTLVLTVTSNLEMSTWTNLLQCDCQKTVFHMSLAEWKTLNDLRSTSQWHYWRLINA